MRPVRRPARRLALMLLGPLVVGLLLLGMSPPAVAATDDEEIARELDDRGVYVEPGSGVDASSVSAVVRDLAEDGVDVRFVALAQEPPGGSTTLAQTLGTRLPGATVVVRSPADLGYYSTVYDEADQERAVDAAFDDFRRGADAQALRTFGETLQRGGGVPVPGTRPGVPAGNLLLLALLVIGGVALFRGSRTTRRVSAQRVAQARAEVRHQIDYLSEKILALSDRVTIGSAEAQEAYAQATAAFRQASEGFAAATTEAQLTRLNDSLDRARWQLEVATALLDGREPPSALAGDAPACFFDPDHGAGVRQATLQTAAGDREVGVCDYCAGKLDRGEAPEPRRIAVGADSVPVSMAPREYGGHGMRDLDAFSILFGRGGPVPYRWGGYGGRGSRRSRRSRGGGGFGAGGIGGGGFGGGIGGGSRRGGGGGGRSFGGGGGGRRFGGGGGRSFGSGGGRRF